MWKVEKLLELLEGELCTYAFFHRYILQARTNNSKFLFQKNKPELVLANRVF